MDINGINVNVAFEVFDSGGKWDFLFGKTLVEMFKATHNYESDKITIHGKGGKTTLYNQSHIAVGVQLNKQPSPTVLICITTEETQPHGEELAEIDVTALKNDVNLFT